MLSRILLVTLLCSICMVHSNPDNDEESSKTISLSFNRNRGQKDETPDELVVPGVHVDSVLLKNDNDEVDVFNDRLPNDPHIRPPSKIQTKQVSVIQGGGGQQVTLGGGTVSQIGVIQGATSYINCRCAPGIPGPDGDPGLLGQDGDKGIKGVQGNPGPNGQDGTPGANGLKGFKGVQGQMGDLGPIGPQGFQGGQGPDGLKGAKGMKGDVGGQGQTGIQGNPGPQGVKGQKGVKGVKGINWMDA